MTKAAGIQEMVVGARVRAALDEIDGPYDEVKMLRLYNATMAKLEQQERSRGRLSQLWSALVARMTGAVGGVRLLTR